VHLSPKETDRLLLFLAAELARKRRARGLKLNYPEARALIADEIVEWARDGLSVAEAMGRGAEILTADDVLPGVARLVGTLQVEGVFPDGQKLVTVHDPIGPGSHPEPEEDQPGAIVTQPGDIELSAGRETAELTVMNTGDRPVQVGSHFHFFEVNRALRFDRETAFGMHLDIPAGTSARFEPGEARTVGLVAFGGEQSLHGLNQLTNGDGRADAIRRAREQGFIG
jgi:urease subunit gamma/beta